MNLLTANWLPFRTRQGEEVYGPPPAISDPDIIDLALPRADFQGAAYQWLIGLLQTTLAPEGYNAWMAALAKAPGREVLERAFAPLQFAFELDGDGPRFMQDLDPLSDAQPSPVSGLLIDAPGANGIKNNTDFFVKRGGVEVMCPDCAAMALFTMQINAPVGGQGHRAGLRGGGPLTTLILPDDPGAGLWQRLWLNILPTFCFQRGGQPSVAPAADDDALFPWVGPTRESYKGPEVLPDQMHPLHSYWPMPRRYRLVIEEQPCRCDLCGRDAETGVRDVRTKNYGTNYEGPWVHPLTPYRRDPKKPSEPPLSGKGQPGGLGYRNWSYLVLPDPDETGALPAKVVTDFINGKYPANRAERDWGQDVDALLTQPRLWVFGYDMDNMKPRCWYATEMPLLVLPDELQESFRDAVQQFTELARQVAWYTRMQIKNAWFARPGDAKGDTGHLDAQFHENSERAFFRALHEVRTLLISEGKDALPIAVAEFWFQVLRRTSLDLFEREVLTAAPEAMDWPRAVSARGRLLAWFGGKGKGAKAVTNFAKYYAFSLTKRERDNASREEMA